MTANLAPEVSAVAAATTPDIKPWPKVTQKDETPLAYQIGLELTMMPPVLSGKPHHDDSDRRIARSYASILDYVLNRSKVSKEGCASDQKAVEVTSGILKKWGAVKTFYDGVSKCMLECGLSPHVEQVISGGGHIHVGKVPTRLMVVMLRDLQNRPYLNWVFNDPDDKHSSKSYAEDLECVGAKLKAAAKGLTVNPTLFADSLTNEGRAALLFYGDPKFAEQDWVPDDKSRFARHCDNHNTFEFRFFQAPANWEEQEAHIRFVEAYMHWCETTYKTTAPEVQFDNGAKLAAVPEDWCHNQFISFLATLGLPLAPYQRMLDENLPDRFKRGVRN